MVEENDIDLDICKKMLSFTKNLNIRQKLCSEWLESLQIKEHQARLEKKELQRFLTLMSNKNHMIRSS